MPYLPTARTPPRRFALPRSGRCATVDFTSLLCFFLRRETIPAPAIVLSGAWFDLLAESNTFTLLQQTGLTAKIVLLILVGFSLFSWAIIYQKYRAFALMRVQSARFLHAFRSSTRLPEPKTIAAGATASPLTAVYAAGYHELAGQVSGSNPFGAPPQTENPQGKPEPRKIKSLNAIHVVMQLVATEEIHKMERWMPWLATTGSVTPFIGLFGTVVGVMNAFLGLGTAGAASLRAVAPGIADALVTTAAGLFAAVPAVIAYNYFLHEIKEYATRLNNFSAEFSAQVEKHYTL